MVKCRSQGQSSVGSATVRGMQGRNPHVVAAESLAAWLSTISLAGRSSQQATRLITEAIAEWARRQGWEVEFEVPALITRPVRGGREFRGRLDIVCDRGEDLPLIAIEVDRGNKRWSLQKLVAEAEAGNLAIWVRWKGRHLIDVPEQVGLVDIRHLFRGQEGEVEQQAEPCQHSEQRTPQRAATTARPSWFRRWWSAMIRVVRRRAS